MKADRFWRFNYWRNALALALMVTASLAALALIELGRIKVELTAIVDSGGLSLKHANILSAAIHVEDQVVPRLILSGEAAVVDREWTRVLAEREVFDATRSRLSAPSSTEQAKALLRSLDTAVLDARRLHGQIVTLAASHDDRAASLRLLDEAHAVTRRAQQFIADFSSLHEADVAATYQEALGDLAIARLSLVGLGALGLGLGVLFGVVTEAQRQRVTRALRAAEQANRAKSELLATVSHDIRTPMHGVLGMAELLESSALSAEQRQQVQSLRHSGQLMRSLLDDILDFAKMEAGQLRLESREFNLRQCVEACVDLFRPLAEKKGLELRFEYANGNGKFLMGDPLRIQQVLNNLLSNAVKFTSQGVIRVKVEPDGAAGTGAYRLCVRDTGPGLSPEHLRQLFKPYMQADASVARRFGGTGLGLAISRRLVKAMGGDLVVDSKTGEGTRFCFSLTFLPTSIARLVEAQPAHPPSLAAQVQAERAGPATKSRLNVLVVEDNPVNVMYAQALVERMGHQVDVAIDGEQAIERMVARRYDLILMDRNMPVMDGLEATRRIRQAEAKIGAPASFIVGATAYASTAERKECIDAGMNSVISKPFSRHDVESLLAELSA